MEKKLIYTLPLLSAFNGISFFVFGLNIRLEQLWIVITDILFLILVLLGGRKFYWDKAGFFLFFLWCVSLISSYLYSPDRTYSLIQSVNIITISSSFFLMPVCLTQLSYFFKFLKNIFKIAIFISAWGLVLYIFSIVTGIPSYGVNLTQNESDAYGVYMTMREQNIFGSYMLCVFLMSLPLLFSRAEIPFMRKNFLRSVMLFSLLGIFLSFTRAVWIAVALCSFIYFSINFRKLGNNFFKILFLIVALVLFSVILSHVFHVEFINYKLLNLFNSESSTARGRLVIWGIALDNWIQNKHFLVGNGTYSFASFFNNDTYDNEQNAWIGNHLITFLHDTGILGILFFFFFIGFLINYCIKKTKCISPKDHEIIKHTKMGLLLGIIGVNFAFFFTSALSYSYSWILFGLCAAINRIDQLKHMSKYNKKLNKKI